MFYRLVGYNYFVLLYRRIRLKLQTLGGVEQQAVFKRAYRLLSS